MKALVPLVAALLLVAPAAQAQDDQARGAPKASFRPRSGRFTYGGSVGFGIGTGTWSASLRGEVGDLATDRHGWEL